MKTPYEMNCTPKVRQKKSNFWGVFIMKLTYEDKVGLTLACLNNKKLVKIIVGKICYFIQISQYYWILRELSVNIKKTIIKNDVCLHSEIMTESLLLWSCRRLGLYPLFPKIFGKIHLSRQNVSYFSKSKKKHKKRLRESCLYIYF